MTEIHKAPQEYKKDNTYTIFLGGSIEQNKAERWQDRITEKLKGLNVRILNPRRDDYQVDQKQSINNPYFKEQVDWELMGLEDSNLIVMYLQPGTYSPISLLEIGMYCEKSKLRICCPDGFWRKGNIEIICDKFGIDLYHNFEEFEKSIIKTISEFGQMDSFSILK